LASEPDSRGMAVPDCRRAACSGEKKEEKRTPNVEFREGAAGRSDLRGGRREQR
jgi:hypothetical protein